MTARTAVPNDPPSCWVVRVSTLKRVPDERITSIVDDLFLPLVTGTSRR